MPTITIESKLYQQLEEVAEAQESNTQAIAHDAFRLYLWEQNRRAISKESQIYRQQHIELKAQYLGEFVAMYQGIVVDNDEDFQMLYKRVKKRFGRTPVMITEVKETPDTVLMRRGFRFAQ